MTRRHAALTAIAALAAGLASAALLADLAPPTLQGLGGGGDGLPPASVGGAPGPTLLLGLVAVLTLVAVRAAAHRRGPAFLLAAMGATALFPIVQLQYAALDLAPRLPALLHGAAVLTLWLAVLAGAAELGHPAWGPRVRQARPAPVFAPRPGFHAEPPRHASIAPPPAPVPAASGPTPVAHAAPRAVAVASMAMAPRPPR